MIIDTLVEGATDEIVARKIISYCRHDYGFTFGKKGCDYIHNKIQGFNIRARYGSPILAMIDFMDTKLRCPFEAVSMWIPNKSPKLLFRVVVKELESWLMADREGLSNYFGISQKVLPRTPELLVDPKQELKRLAGRSRKRKIRRFANPISGASTLFLPGYTSMIEEYVHDYWNIDSAMVCSPSLTKCISRLRNLQ